MTSRSPKILVAVVHGPYQPWLDILHNGQSKTWAASPTKIPVVHAFGIPVSLKRNRIDQRMYFLRWHKNKIIAYVSLAFEGFVKEVMRLDRRRSEIEVTQSPGIGQIWTVDMPDLILLQGVKNLAVFRKSLDYDFDYFVTTITSSYINLQALEDSLATTPRDNFLGGRIEQSGSREYQQGSFRVYSRYIIEYIVKNSKYYKHWLIEDIAMGRLLDSGDFKLQKMSNVTLATMSELEDLDPSVLSHAISYRCKSTAGPNRIDDQIMQRLHARILEQIRD